MFVVVEEILQELCRTMCIPPRLIEGRVSCTVLDEEIFAFDTSEFKEYSRWFDPSD